MKETSNLIKQEMVDMKLLVLDILRIYHNSYENYQDYCSKKMKLRKQQEKILETNKNMIMPTNPIVIDNELFEFIQSLRIGSVK